MLYFKIPTGRLPTFATGSPHKPLAACQHTWRVEIHNIQYRQGGYGSSFCRRRWLNTADLLHATGQNPSVTLETEWAAEFCLHQIRAGSDTICQTHAENLAGWVEPFGRRHHMEKRSSLCHPPSHQKIFEPVYWGSCMFCQYPFFLCQTHTWK